MFGKVSGPQKDFRAFAERSIIPPPCEPTATQTIPKHKILDYCEVGEQAIVLGDDASANIGIAKRLAV